jgi:hypothetical protein
MSAAFFDRLILNSPYAYPAQHWELDESGQPTNRVIERRRQAQYVSPIPKPQNAWRAFLNHLSAANTEASPRLARLALKLATGASKTTVVV